MARKHVNRVQECCVCGKLHCDIEDRDTKYIKTKRKTELYFSLDCFYKSNEQLKEQK